MDSTSKAINPDAFHFHTVDYCVFAAMLIFSATSGGYFGFVKYVHQNNSKFFQFKMNLSNRSTRLQKISGQCSRNARNVSKRYDEETGAVRFEFNERVSVGVAETETVPGGNEFGGQVLVIGPSELGQFIVLMYAFNFSYISGVTILGTPAEIYNFGTQYWLIVIPILLMGFAVSSVYLPVFTALRVGSSYEVMGSNASDRPGFCRF